MLRQLDEGDVVVEGVGVVWSEHPLLFLEQLVSEWARLGAPAEQTVGVGQIHHRHERIGMVRTERAFLDFPQLGIECRGVRIFSLPVICSGQVVHRRERLG